MLLEEQERVEGRTEELKHALVASDPAMWMDKLYPKLESEQPEDEYDLAGDTTGKWIMPQMSPEEILSFEKEWATRGGTIGVEDLDDEGEWI